MEKFKALRFAILFLLLMLISILGGPWAYLVFPAIACLFAFLVYEEVLRNEIKTIITGVCLIGIFLFWHYIQFDKLPFLFVLIYTLAIMAAIEGWRFTIHHRVNVWGLMNLVVFWIGIEYLMLLWLPFDVSGWLLGAPLMKGRETSDGWLIFTGQEGYSLWTLLSGLLLFKSLNKGRIFVPALIGSVLLIVVPILIEPVVEDYSEYYAQGEWIGRTCIWLSVLILAYSFVKRKTKT